MSNSKLIIRTATADDAGAVLDVYSHYINNTTATFEETVPSAEQFRLRMEEIMEDYPFLVCMDGSRIAGYAYAHRHQSRSAYRYGAELSVYMRPKYVGLGIGRILCDTLIALLRLQNVQTVYSAVSLPNDASCALHSAMGFTQAGLWENAGYKKNRWIDVVWYRLAVGSYPDRPAPFVRFGQLDTAAVCSVLSDAAQKL